MKVSIHGQNLSIGMLNLMLKLYTILIIVTFTAISVYALQSPSIDLHVNELWLLPIFLDCGYVSAITSFQTCGDKYILYTVS